MSFVLFYTLFYMFNALFYVIGYNSRHLNKKEHIWRKIGLKQIVELRLQLGKVEAVAPDSKIAKNTFMNFPFSFLCLVSSPRYFKTINKYF